MTLFHEEQLPKTAWYQGFKGCGGTFWAFLDEQRHYFMSMWRRLSSRRHSGLELAPCWFRKLMGKNPMTIAAKTAILGKRSRENSSRWFWRRMAWPRTLR